MCSVFARRINSEKSAKLMHSPPFIPKLIISREKHYKQFVALLRIPGLYVNIFIIQQ